MKPRRVPMKRTEIKRGTPELKRTEFKRKGSGFQSGAKNASRFNSTRGSVGDASPDGPTRRPNGPVKVRRAAKPGESAAERDARRLVWARASRETGDPLCEVCGIRLAAEYQHRKAKAHCTRAERWAPANGLAVCGHGNLIGCHGRIHQNPTEAEAHGWTVLSCQDPVLESVVRRGVRVLFDDQGGMAAVEQGSAA